MIPRDGGPAFPVPMIPIGPNDDGFTEVRETGISVLDLFACFALVGLLAEGQTKYTEAARDSYALAETMLDMKRRIESSGS